MANDLTKYDGWLCTDENVAALVVREYLIPVEGAEGVIFPATFAASEDKTFKGGYNIDRFNAEFDARVTWNGQERRGDYSVKFADHQGERNVCLIDSVGSQANRIEPMFRNPDYASLVPQVVIKAGEKEVNLLDAGHRAGDAIVRCSSLQAELQDAFKAVQKGDAEPLAKVAPTSLVFGVWDSRDTQAKLPRLINSTIRAFDVNRLTRSAQFNPPLNYAELKVFSEEDKAKAEGDSKNPLAKRGFIHVPATGSHGGVIATGGIRRDATLSLAALRLLRVGKDEPKTLALRRYIFGLALTAFTHPPASYLRQGCNLVADPDKPREFVEVHIDGKRVPAKITHTDALAFATAAAKAFGVGTNRTVDFDTKLAVRDVRGEAEDVDAEKPRKPKK